jgi:hypothetical protein
MLTDLPAGLGVIGPGVLGLDAEGEELLFGDPGHLVVALGGEDEPVVAEEGGRVAPALGRFVEDADDVVGLDHLHGSRRHAQPRVVVDHVEHLVDLAAPELHVGHVGLPGLIRQVGDEPLERALRTLLR